MSARMIVRFHFYWDWKGEEPAADYFVYETDGRLPLHGNVSQQQLIDAQIAIPPTPTIATWRKMVAENKRCRGCWKSRATSLCCRIAA